MHPNAVIPVRYNTRAVSQGIITNVLAFIVIYMMIVGISMIIMSIMGLDLDTEAMKKVTARIIELGDKKHTVTTADLPYIISDVLKGEDLHQPIKIKSFSTLPSSKACSTSSFP